MALTPPMSLIRLLRSSFENIGDPAELEVYPSPTGEYHVLHKGYHFAWHAWANADQTNPERIRSREIKRLPFLSRKLMDDLADANRIFVVTHTDMTLATAIEVLTAMHLHGRPTLMFVTQGETLGVVKQGDYLLHATIPKFADEAAVTTTTRPTDWLTMCEQARAVNG